jgi:hypothetical protein
MNTFYETQRQLCVGRSAHLPAGHAQEPVLKMQYGYSYILMRIQIDTFKVFLWVRIKIPCGMSW